MDKTYCIVRLPECIVTFDGIDAEKYTAVWNDIKNERLNVRMPLIDKLEKKLEPITRELKTLVDDRTFCQKLCGVKTETSKRIAELQNESCCILDDIFTLKDNIVITPSELHLKLSTFLAERDFGTLDHGCTVQVWTKVHK